MVNLEISLCTKVNFLFSKILIDPELIIECLEKSV